MLKQIAWNTFKNTGNIDTMMELIQVDKVSKDQINNVTNPKIDVNKNDEKYFNNMENKYKL